MLSNGSYITNAPFISSTSTPAVLGESTSASVTPPDNSSTSTTTADPTRYSCSDNYLRRLNGDLV
jgi:hypothetical protein